MPTRWEAVRIRYLARSGSLPQQLEKMATVPKDQRPIVGRAANETKMAVQEAFEARKAELTPRGGKRLISIPRYQVVTKRPVHFIPCCKSAIAPSIFFIAWALPWPKGPDIENEAFNFDALNTLPDHPARNESDTFYLIEDGLAPSPGLRDEKLGGRRLLRTQTSTVQIRAMLSQPPPLRIVSPGRCYRRDEIDAHARDVLLFKWKGLVVGEGVTLADLKGTLEYFFRELLGEDLKFRFRPHFFPLHRAQLRGRLLPRRHASPRQRNGWKFAAAAWSILPSFTPGRLRSRPLHGVRLRLRPRAHRHDAARHSRFALLQRK